MNQKFLFKSIAVLGLTVTGASGVFAATSGNTAQNRTSDVTTTLTPPIDITNPTPPQPDGAGQGQNTNNENNSLNSNFGIAYQPKSFVFQENNLHSSGEQEISISNEHPGATYNVGVKDKSHDTKGWELKAQLLWKNHNLPGSSITTNGNVLSKNLNHGSDFNRSQDLEALTSNKEASIVDNLEIHSTPTTVMTGNEGVIHDSVYDDQLENLKLKLIDTSLVAAGAYSGTVNWDLQLTPSGNNVVS